MPKSTVKTARRKPEKPYKGFPMFAHPSGQWAKKINKKLFYFGVWADPDAALVLLNHEYPHLKAGRTPPAVDASDGCDLRKLCREFIRSKEAKLNSGDLSPRTFRDYYRTCETLIGYFGKDRKVDDLWPEDFRTFRVKLAARYNVTSLKNEVNRVRILFRYAKECKLIKESVAYGQNFDGPSAKALRRNRNEAGEKLFEREEILQLLEAADVGMKAMILLGINCAFGNSDVASLPQKAVDLETGWVVFPRVKTEIRRRTPLWPETIDALRKAFAARPAPANAEGKGLCFLTNRGNPWVRISEKPDAAENVPRYVPIDILSVRFGKLLKRLEMNGRRGLGFYTLRHCFETFAGESKDQVTVDAVMGHVDNSQAANYRHRISDKRLKDVVETVRRWLFSDRPEIGEGGAK